LGEWSTSVVNVNGYDIRVAESGAGVPVLFLDDVLGPYGKGLATDALAHDHAVSIPVHPGFDGSPLPSWLDNVSDLANFYLDYLDARGSGGVHLVGCGLGGWVAADLATRNTNRLASLTLVAAGGLALRGVPQCDIFLGADDDVLRKVIHDPKVADRVIAETLTADSEDMRLQNQQVSARLMWQPRLHDPDLVKWLHRIDVPTLIVWGENDALYPKPYAAAWRDKIPNARLEMIANCGHLPQVERPDELAKLVSRFIADRRVAA
jgi:pimeloyl-ACP methyl ester carboxylesterase